MSETTTILVKSLGEYELALKVRREVFVREQGVPESIEVDAYEKEATHFLTLFDGIPVGTGRLRLKKSYAKFERIATLKSHRGHGLGRSLMDLMLRYAQEHHPLHLPAMHAQLEAVGFYVKLRWVPIGEVFEEASILHRVLIYPPHSKAELKHLLAWKDPEVHDDIKNHLKTLLA